MKTTMMSWRSMRRVWCLNMSVVVVGIKIIGTIMFAAEIGKFVCECLQEVGESMGGEEYCDGVSFVGWCTVSDVGFVLGKERIQVDNTV